MDALLRLEPAGEPHPKPPPVLGLPPPTPPLLNPSSHPGWDQSSSEGQPLQASIDSNSVTTCLPGAGMGERRAHSGKGAQEDSVTDWEGSWEEQGVGKVKAFPWV